MLNRVYEAHKFDSDVARAKADNLKSQALGTVGAVTDSLVECLNGGIKNFFVSFFVSSFTCFALLVVTFHDFVCVRVCV